MPLADGTRVDHYEIIGLLGAGGMGEVYRAVDTKLRREVAIKILPPQFASDPSRLARFEREAHLLASLNHPNIAAIYGLEHAGGIRFLVLELVEGPTLAERLKSGPLDIRESLRIASGITEALEAAHEKGVVHRDLKPGNVKITPAGKVKVLDFGLAKAMGEPEPPHTSSDPAAQSTVTTQETKAGVVMGTAAYMSPEQAEAKPTDKRSDVWSFGVVLFEMLSGKRCFDGKSTTHILMHLLEDQPDWTKLPVSVPASLRHLLERCLQKDPAKRLRDVGDLRLQLEAMAEEASLKPVRQRTEMQAKGMLSWLWRAIAVAAVLAALALAFVYLRPKPAPVQAMRFDIAAPDQVTLSDNFTVSPDGHKLAFIATGVDRVRRLWVRSLETGDARAFDGTENAAAAPIWSRDSRSVVFESSEKLMRIDTLGGLPQTLANIGIFPVLGGFWTSDNRIVFGGLRTGVREVPAAGGTAVPIIPGGVRANPWLLPDQRHFLYLNVAGGADSGLYVGSLDSKEDQRQPQKLLQERSSAAFVPEPGERAGSEKGYLLFLRGATITGLTSSGGSLTAQAFDAGKLELTGEPLPIAEQVGSFSVSPAGVLVYRAASTTSAPSGLGSPTWFDRQGKALGPAVEPGVYSAVTLSPDGKRLAASHLVPPNVNNEIWLFEFARGIGKRFSFDPGLDSNPVWSPDGSRVVFSSTQGTRGNWDLYLKPSNGAGEAEVLFKSDEHKWVTSWSVDSRFLLFHNVRTPGNLSVLPMKDGKADPERKLFVFAEGASQGKFSPDMRWIAYISGESGQAELWVRPFDPSSPTGSPPSSGKWMISRDGAVSPRWRGDGKELLYTAPDGSMMSVEVNTSARSPVFDAGVPKLLFKNSDMSGLTGSYWDVSQDGKRFLLPFSATPQAAANVAPPPGSNAPYKVVLNWTSLLKK